MMKIKKHIITKITSVLIIAGGLILSSSYAYAQSCGGSSCGNSTCSLSLGSDGMLDTPCPSGTRYDVDPNCIMNQNASAGSCMDTMPVASINRVSETNCYRANGAGGNPKPRNHLGTDYAATQGTVVTAAADGKVVSAANMNGGGRTIIIEHEKVCQCSAGNAGGKCDDKYISVYMHLSAFLVNGGSVSKGQPIGKVGGSNYKNGVLCDYPDSNTSDSCKPYGPHLHFEIHSGAWEKGYSALKSSIINPLCDDIQQFCGGCNYDVQQCQGKEGAQEWENLSEDAAANKTQAASTGMNTPPVGGSSNGSGNGSITQDGCPLSKFLPDDDTCWFCPMFKVLFNTASVIAKKAFEALAAGIVAVVVVMFAIWISVYILKHVSAVEVKDPRKMLQELMLQAFKVVIVVLILVKANFFQVMQLTLEPVFNTGMTFVQAITDVGNSSACSSGSSYMQNIKGYDTSTGMTDDSSGGLPISMGQNIVCSIKTMQDSVAKMMAYGKQAWCVAWGPKSWLFGILPHFGFMITGIVIFLGGFILLLAFPWCLVDCVLQMSVASALAPAAIGAWAFKATKNYLKKIWDLFMNAMFNFVFLSIILYIIMTVVDQFMRGLDQYANESTGWDFLIHPINGLAYWGVTGTKLVVVCLMGWVFLDEGKKFADKFAKGGISGIGRSVGGLAAQAGTKAGKAAFKAGKTVGGAALQVGDHFVGSRVRQWRNDYRMNKVKTGYDNVIHDENGKITGYERTRRNLFGKKVTRRVMINEDGKEVWSKEKHSRRAEIGNFLHKKVNEARHELMFNRDRDENGNLINAKDGIDENGNRYKETEHGKVFYDQEGNEIAREHYHRNLMGRKVTTREELGADGKWSMNRTKNSLRMEIMSRLTPKGSAINQFAQNHKIAKERNLSQKDLSAKVISSDKYMSVRQIKDQNGNVRQEDIAFNTQTIKHLVNSKGEVNTAMVQNILNNSTFDRKTVMKAITMEVLKSRGVEVSNRFMERNITVDDKGKMTINQKNMDGTTTIIEMEYGGPNGNQMLTTVTSQDRHGNTTSISKNNGIQKVDITVDDDRKQTAQYGFTDEYVRRHRYKKPLNRYGEYADTMDEQAASFGFGKYDRELHARQVATGKPQKYDETKDDSRTLNKKPDEMQHPKHQDGKTATIDNPVRNTTTDANGWQTTTESYVDPNGVISNNKTVKDDKGRIVESVHKDSQGNSYHSKIDFDDKNNKSIERETWTDKNGKTASTTTYKQYDKDGKVISEHTVKEGEHSTEDTRNDTPTPDNPTPETQPREESPEEKAEREAREKAEREAREKAEREAREKAEQERIKAENRNKISTETLTDPNGDITEITKDANGVVLNIKVKKAGEDKFKVYEQRTTYANGNVSEETIRNDQANFVRKAKYDENGKETDRHTIQYNANNEKILEERVKNGVTVHSYFKSQDGNFREKTYNDDGTKLTERQSETDLNGVVNGVHETHYHSNGKVAIDERKYDDGTNIFESYDEQGIMREKTISKTGYLNKQLLHEDGTKETIIEDNHGKTHTIKLNGEELKLVIEDEKGLVEHREQTENGRFKIHRSTQDENLYYRDDYGLENKPISSSILDKDGNELEKTEFNSSGWKTKHTKHLDNGYTEVTTYSLNETIKHTTLYDSDGKKVN